MKNMFKVKITYDTGDSFHTEEGIETELEETYTTLKRAEENLNRIKEHYEFYDTLDDYNRGWYFNDAKKKAAMEKIIEDAKSKPWYVKNHPEYSLKLLLNNGRIWQISAFWCGHFERLVSAEIVVETPKIKFN